MVFALAVAALAGCGSASEAVAGPFVYALPNDRVRIVPEDGGRVVRVADGEVRLASGAGRWVATVGDRLFDGAGLRVREARTGRVVALRFDDGLGVDRVRPFSAPAWDAAGGEMSVVADVPSSQPLAPGEPVSPNGALALVRCRLPEGTCTRQVLADQSFGPKVSLAGYSGPSGPLLWRIPQGQPPAAALPLRCGGPREQRVRGGIVRVVPLRAGEGGWERPAVLEGLVDGPSPGEMIGDDVTVVGVGDGALLADVPDRGLLLRGVRCEDGEPTVGRRSETGSQRARLRVRRGQETISIRLPGPLARADRAPTRYVSESDGGALLIRRSRVYRYRPGKDRLSEVTTLSAGARRTLERAPSIWPRTGARGELVVQRTRGRRGYGPIQRVPPDGRDPKTLARNGRLIG